MTFDDNGFYVWPPGESPMERFTKEMESWPDPTWGPILACEELEPLVIYTTYDGPEQLRDAESN